MGQDASPSGGIFDSQTVKAPAPGAQRSFDGDMALATDHPRLRVRFRGIGEGFVTSPTTHGHPTRVEIEIDGQPLSDDVVSFGSDGGGGYFCVSRSNGAIYHLPPGRIDENDENNVYLAGLCDPRFVVPSFEAFLQRVLTITKELVIDRDTDGIFPRTGRLPESPPCQHGI